MSCPVSASRHGPLASFVLDRVHAVGQLTGAGQRLRPLAAADDRQRGILTARDRLCREAHHPVRMQRFGPDRDHGRGQIGQLPRQLPAQLFDRSVGGLSHSLTTFQLLADTG